MTRILSALLGAKEPEFRLGLRKLEAAHGHPNTDIRLTAELVQAGKNKLKLLGLDPNDTTASELYHALQEKVKRDDTKLEKTLRTRAATHVSAEGDVVAGMVHALQELPLSRSCYALKPSILKNLIKKQTPKKAMKQLGYRSLESLLKNEGCNNTLAAAWLTESASWRKSFIDQYRSLAARDFETRPISITMPTSKRWTKLSETTVTSKRHNLVSLKELGLLVILPLPADKPAGSTTAVLALALHALNEIRAASTFLQLAQVRGDFGRMVQLVASDEATLNTHMFGQDVSWNLLHQYYARLKDVFRDDIFEPYLSLEDLSWHAVEKVMSHIEPDLAFWHDSAHLGLVHDGKAVSLNLLDSALGLCNDLPFENLLVHYGRSALSQEVMLRYLKPEAVEQAVKTTMQPQLATEEVLI